jgi:hypothetical protein
MRAVSKKLIPRSRARFKSRVEDSSSRSGSLIAPKPTIETLRPVLPSLFFIMLERKFN